MEKITYRGHVISVTKDDDTPAQEYTLKVFEEGSETVLWQDPYTCFDSTAKAIADAKKMIDEVLEDARVIDGVAPFKTLFAGMVDFLRDVAVKRPEFREDVVKELEVMAIRTNIRTDRELANATVDELRSKSLRPNEDS